MPSPACIPKPLIKEKSPWRNVIALRPEMIQMNLIGFKERFLPVSGSSLLIDARRQTGL